MIGAVRRLWDNFRGGGEAAVTVPPMDGALRPNQRLEQAPLVLGVPAPDNLVSNGERVLFSSEAKVVDLDAAAGSPREVHRFECEVTALAIASDGGLAVGLDDGRVILRGGARDGFILRTLGGAPLVCPTALLFDAAGHLLIAQGSASRPPSQWKHDVMSRGASGSVWRVDLSSGAAACLASRLSWPYRRPETARWRRPRAGVIESLFCGLAVGRRSLCWPTCPAIPRGSSPLPRAAIG